MQDAVLTELSQLMAQPQPSLLRCALLAATAERTLESLDQWQQQFDQFCAGIAQRISPDDGPAQRLRHLNHAFFTQLGLHGNQQDYYNPANSDLPSVWQARQGLPISLSVLYICMGQALGLKLSGVAFPQHFLVKCSTAQGMMILDIFEGGKSLPQSELQHRLNHALQQTHAPLDQYLLSASTLTITLRILNNLKAVYVQQAQWDQLLNVQQKLVSLKPKDPTQLRDRAIAYVQNECARAALDDYSAYLQAAPDAPDIQQVKQAITQLQAAVKRLN